MLHSGTNTQKVIFMYSDKIESSMLAKSMFEYLPDSLETADCQFGMINLAKNEIKDLEGTDLPSMVILRGYADLNAANYEGAWTIDMMKQFIDDKMYMCYDVDRRFRWLLLGSKEKIVENMRIWRVLMRILNK